MSLLNRGELFTTEPSINRSLASEIRFNPEATRSLFREICKIHQLGPLDLVTCERTDHANIDILVAFENATVGLECKIGHRLSKVQWEAELKAVDYLIAVVKESSDVPDQAIAAGVKVCTWSEILSIFKDSRLEVEDVNNLNDEKRIARRELGAIDLIGSVPSGWTFEDADGDGGYPSVIITSDYFDPACTRWVVFQVELSRNGNGYIANVGVSVSHDDFSPSVVEPEWLRLVRILGEAVEDYLALTDFPISKTSGSHQRLKDGSPSSSTYKIQAAREFDLPLHYATGYTNSYVGVRSIPIEGRDLKNVGQLFLSAAEDAHRKLKDYYDTGN